MSRSTADIRHLTQPRRGLSREESAVYIGVSPTKFDEMVAVGLMPKPKTVGGRKVYDIRRLDVAFDALDDEEAPSINEWDQGKAA